MPACDFPAAGATLSPMGVPIGRAVVGALVAGLVLGGAPPSLGGEQARVPARAAAPPSPPPAAVQAAGAGAKSAAPVPPPAPEGAAEGERLVRYANGRLSVRVWDEDLREVLEEIGRQAGAEMKLDRLEDRTVTCDFADLPLDKGLQRLLRDQNFTLVYVAAQPGGGQARLRSLEVFSAKGSYGSVEPAVAPTTASTLPPKAEAPAKAGIRGLVEHFDQIPVAGQLAEALGSDRVSLQTLFAASVSEPDPAVRRQAISRMVSVIDADPEAEQFTLDAIDAMDPDTLASLLRGYGAERSAELLREIMARARGRDLRSAASEVLNRLLAAPSQEATLGTPPEP